MYNQTGFSKSYLPKRQQASIYPSKQETQNSDLAETVYLDNLFDLKRWIKNSKEEMEEYVNKNLELSYERTVDVPNDYNIEKLKSEISDIRGFLIDMRKGIDWYKSNYDEIPSFLMVFQDELNSNYFRLRRLRSYLSHRLRKYGALNYTHNKNISVEKAKLMKQYIEFKLKAIDIFLSQRNRYTVRKNWNIEDIDED